MAWDLVLFVLSGIAVIVLAVWGGIVAVKALPEGQDPKPHFWVFIGVGVVAVILTIATGWRNYSSQKDAAEEQRQLRQALETDGNLIKSQGTLLSQTKATLDQSRINEAQMDGELKMVGPMLASIHGDQSSAISKMADVLETNSQHFGFIPNRFHGLAPAELKRETLDLTAKMRQFVMQYEAQERKIMEPWGDPHTTQEQRKAITQQTAALDMLFINTYQSKFRPDAVLLRDELRTREKIALDPKKRSSLDLLYDDAINELVVQDVASDLEKMAAMIPDSKPRRHQK